MKLHQLSVFVETGVGQLRAHTEALRNAGMTIVAMSLADTPRYGVLRLVVKDWQGAKRVLEDAGAVVNVSEVVPLEVDDGPGGLSSTLVALADAGLGVEYLYDLPARPGAGKAAVVARFEDPDRAIAAMRERGIREVDEHELGSI